MCSSHQSVSRISSTQARGDVPVVVHVVVVEDHRRGHRGQEPADHRLGPALAVEPRVLGVVEHALAGRLRRCRGATRRTRRCRARSRRRTPGRPSISSRSGHSSRLCPRIRSASSRRASISRPRSSSSLRRVQGGSWGAATRQEPKAIRSGPAAGSVRKPLGGKSESGSGQTRSPSSRTSYSYSRAGLEPVHVDQPVVVPADAERALARTEHLHLARARRSPPTPRRRSRPRSAAGGRARAAASPRTYPVGGRKRVRLPTRQVRGSCDEVPGSPPAFARAWSWPSRRWCSPAPAAATAAKVITGKQIKNSSITSADIKNNSLVEGDFKSGRAAGGVRADRRAPRGCAALRDPRGPRARTGSGSFAIPETATPFVNGEADLVGTLCPAGTYPTGGGAWAADTATLETDHPEVITSQGFLFNDAGIGTGYFANVNNVACGARDRRGRRDLRQRRARCSRARAGTGGRSARRTTISRSTGLP